MVYAVMTIVRRQVVLAEEMTILLVVAAMILPTIAMEAIFVHLGQRLLLYATKV